MNRLQMTLRAILILCTSILAATAVPGGAMLLFGVYAPPREMLEGSVFSSFAVPGVALAVAVGGVAILALVLVVRRSAWARFASTVAGLAVVSFEFVQVLTIGSPAGSARAMQVGYFVLGLVLAVTAAIGSHFDALTSRPESAFVDPCAGNP